MLSLFQRLEYGTRTVNTREGSGVTAPVNLNILLLQGEEDDQGADGDSAREGRRGDTEGKSSSVRNLQIKGSGGHLLVVLGPPGQVIPPNIVVEGEGDRDCGPNIAHVVRSPDKSTDQKDGNVEVGENLELLAEEVEGDGQDSTNEETPQEAVVDGSGTEHLLGAESTPKDGSGEECVVSRAGEVILLLGQADVGDLGHLVVENCRTDKGGDECRPHLAVEGDPRGDVHVMGELEILSEVKCVRGCNVSVRLEVVHGGSVSGEPETTKKFSNDVQGNLNVRDGHDNTARNTEDRGEENCRVR